MKCPNSETNCGAGWRNSVYDVTGGSTMTKSTVTTTNTKSSNSETLMTFESVKMSSTYNGNFKAENALNADINSFAHTLKGVGQFW